MLAKRKDAKLSRKSAKLPYEHMLSVYNARHHCESEWFMNKVGDWLGYIGIDPKDAS